MWRLQLSAGQVIPSQNTGIWKGQKRMSDRIKRSNSRFRKKKTKKNCRIYKIQLRRAAPCDVTWGSDAFNTHIRAEAEAWPRPLGHMEDPAKHSFWQEVVNTGLSMLLPANWPCEAGSPPPPVTFSPPTFYTSRGENIWPCRERDVGTCSEEKNPPYSKWPNLPFSQRRPAALPVGSHRSPGCRLEVRAAENVSPGGRMWLTSLNCLGRGPGRTERDSRWRKRNGRRRRRFTTAPWGRRASSSVFKRLQASRLQSRRLRHSRSSQ